MNFYCSLLQFKIKRSTLKAWQCCSPSRCLSSFQHKTSDQRHRLSRFWVPTGGIAANEREDSHTKLVRAGFLRQAHAGIYHMLPLGRRVQDKLEALIDKHMASLDASRLALSSISSEEIWSRSGRLDSAASELFKFRDKKGVKYLLSPTHEEEVTSLVAKTVKSYKELPLRLYQITRKYRDELRPRHGLLRSREFVMKDLYTFDYTTSLALATYEEVRQAYVALFSELKIPFLVAEADSGNMGGNLSHEFHFPTPQGEDHVVSCSNCDYVANEELVESRACNQEGMLDRSGNSSAFQKLREQTNIATDSRIGVWRGISQDRNTLINVWYVPEVSGVRNTSPTLGDTEINVHAIKRLLPEFDTSVDNLVQYWTNLVRSDVEHTDIRPKKIINIIDYRVPGKSHATIEFEDPEFPLWPGDLMGQMPVDLSMSVLSHDPSNGTLLDMLRVKAGDACPRCPHGTLEVRKAIELGHTFYLGSRYSNPLKALVAVPHGYLKKGKSNDSDNAQMDKSDPNIQVALQMGCHGIGISRMIGAVADTLADEKGLNWPRVMAPFEVVVVPGPGLDTAALEVYDRLANMPFVAYQASLDLVLDDRPASLPWKMKDADLVGYPVVIIVGRRWKEGKVCEVQCKRLSVFEEVDVGELGSVVNGLLSTL